MNPCLDLGPSPKRVHRIYENSTKSVKVYNPKCFLSQALKLQPRFLWVRELGFEEVSYMDNLKITQLSDKAKQQLSPLD